MDVYEWVKILLNMSENHYIVGDQVSFEKSWVLKTVRWEGNIMWEVMLIFSFTKVGHVMIAVQPQQVLNHGVSAAAFGFSWQSSLFKREQTSLILFSQNWSANRGADFNAKDNRGFETGVCDFAVLGSIM